MANYEKKRNYTAKLAIASINSGTIVIPGVAEHQITVTDAYCKAIGGAVGAVTTIDIQTTAGTPVTVATFAQAQLTENAVLRAGATGTATAMLGVANAKGVGIRVIKAGSDITTATHVVVSIDYVVSEG